MALAQSKSSRWSFVGTVFQRISTAAPRHFKICSSSSAIAVTVLAILSPLNRLIEMNCHPLFVFGKRRVGLLEIAEFTRFLRRTRCVSEECSEFGCFGSVLLSPWRGFLFTFGTLLCLGCPRRKLRTAGEPVRIG